MVEIVSPAIAAQTVRPSSATEPTPAAAQEIFAPQSPSAAEVVVPEKATFEDAAALFSETPATSPTAEIPEQSPSLEVEPVSVEQASPLRQSTASQLWRKRALYVGAATVGMVLAVSVWGFVFSRPEETLPTGQGGSQEKNTGQTQNSKKLIKPSVTLHPQTSEDPKPLDERKLPQPGEDKAISQTPVSSLPEPLTTVSEKEPKQPGKIQQEPGPTPPLEIPAEPTASTLKQVDLPQVDVKKRLQDKLVQIDYQQIPLLDFLQDIMQSSTIPMTLDPYALAHAGKSANPQISVQLSSGTVESALKNVLASLQLTYKIDSGHLLLHKAPPQGNRMRRVRYGLNDLAGSDPEKLADFANLVKSLVSPDSWQAEGGRGVLRVQEGALIIEQSEANHFQILVLCEKLRVARSQRPLSRFNANLFQLSSRTSQARVQLSSRVSIRFLQPTPIVQILDELTKISGVTFLVDWQALAETGLTIDTETKLVIENRPLSEALAEMLEPLQITSRIIDSRTVQITSQSALADEPEIEFYPVRHLLDQAEDAEKLLERIRDQIADAVLFFDAPSQHVLARLPQPQQQVLEQLLVQWQAER